MPESCLRIRGGDNQILSVASQRRLLTKVNAPCCRSDHFRTSLDRLYNSEGESGRCRLGVVAHTARFNFSSVQPPDATLATSILTHSQQIKRKATTPTSQLNTMSANNISNPIQPAPPSTPLPPGLRKLGPVVKLVRAAVDRSAPQYTDEDEDAKTVDLSSALSEVKVNWLEDARVPQEIRDMLYEACVPAEVLVKNGRRICDFNLVGVNRLALAAFTPLLLARSVHRFEFKSITKMLKRLNRMPVGYFNRFHSFTVGPEPTAPYNGHSNMFSPAGVHGCNVCPTLKVTGRTYEWEIALTCTACPDAPFYRRELAYACATILAKVQRVMGSRTLTHATGQPGITGMTAYFKLAQTHDPFRPLDKDVCIASAGLFRSVTTLLTLRRRFGSHGDSVRSLLASSRSTPTPSSPKACGLIISEIRFSQAPISISRRGWGT